MKNLIISCLCWAAMSFCPQNTQNILDAFKRSNPPMQVLASFMSCQDLHNLSATAWDKNKMSQNYLDGGIHKIVENKKLELKWLMPGGGWYQQRLGLGSRGEILKMKFDHSQSKYEYYCEQLNVYSNLIHRNNGIPVDFEDPNFLLNSHNMQKIANLVKQYMGIRPDRKAAAEKFCALMLKVRNMLMPTS